MKINEAEKLRVICSRICWNRIILLKFTLFLLIAFLNSCIISDKTTVNFKTAKNISIISVDSSALVKKNTYSFQKSKKPLEVKINIDSTEKIISIMSKKTIPQRVYLVDKNHNFNLYKIHSNRVFILYTDTGLNIFRYPSTRKGTINFSISFPWINYYNNVPTKNGYKNFNGFVGIEGGLEYFYRDNHYLSVFYGSAEDFFMIIPVPVKHFGEVQYTYISYLNIRLNNCIKNFDFGYGLNVSKYNWYLQNYSDSTFIPKQANNLGLGLSFSTQYRFTKFFRIGILYQPNFIVKTNTLTFKYQHFFSFEFIAKFPIYIFHSPRNFIFTH